MYPHCYFSSTRRESEGCGLQKVSDSERWTGNPNNDDGEKEPFSKYDEGEEGGLRDP